MTTITPKMATQMAALGRTVYKKTTIPLLSMVLIHQVRKGTVGFTVSNLEETLTFHAAGELGAKICPGGEPLTCVAWDKFLAGLKMIKARKTEMHLSIDLGLVRLRDDGGTQHDIPAIDGSEFPLPELELDGAVTQPIGETLMAVHWCRPHTSEDATRYILNGVHLDETGPTATDGRSLVHYPLEKQVVIDVVIPSTKLTKSTLLKNLDPAGTITDTGKYLTIFDDVWRYTARTPVGTYPNWRQVVPDTSSYTVAIELPEDMTWFKGMEGLMTSSESIALVAAGGSMVVEIGATTMPVPEAEAEGDCRILLNPKYLKKMLACGLHNLKAKPAVKNTKHEKKGQVYGPVMFSGDDGYGVLMPMRG